MIWIELNAKIEPFDDPRVRQALNFAFPQEQILETVFQGLGSPLHGCMPTIYPGFTNRFWKYKYDLEIAKALLKEAGLSSGFRTSLAYNAGDPIQEPIAILYQTTLRQIGVRDTARTNDQVERLELMTQAQEIVMSEAPWVFVAYPGYHFARRANLKGFSYYTSNNLRFQDFRRDE
jgi:peptide/nickel transport system substrate-binding protein